MALLIVVMLVPALAIDPFGLNSPFGLTTPVSAQGGKVKGDYDGDGKVNERDALAALKMVVKSLPVDLNLDMDNDREVTAKDALAILRMAVGKTMTEDTVISGGADCKTPPPKDVLAKLQKTTSFQCSLLNLPCTFQELSQQKRRPGNYPSHFYVPGNMVNAGAMAITWAGTSFSGGGLSGYPDKLTGSVCYSKGNVLVSFDYVSNDPANNLVMSVKNAPCDTKRFMDPKEITSDGRSWLQYTSDRASEVKNYVTRLEWKSYEKEGSAPLYEASLIAGDWSGNCGFELSLY
jgi:hypothetical protein